MVRKEEILAVLRHRVPRDVILTEYGNENPPRSLVRLPSVDKEDWLGNVERFDTWCIGDTVLELNRYCKKSRAWNKTMSSYWWKHYIEGQPGSRYLSNGDLIMAAYLNDYRVIWPKINGLTGVNAYFDMAPI